ncbi:MAG TPA: RAMP superfamily CRISPR-associated protein [Thermoanaerobaculia bacterium]|jgi:CRISPR/Cas system CSM-associated protein Csm3 (group 7 of RAMP superfamily)
MAEPTHSPYNFVPLPETGPDRERYPGLDRIGKDSYSGVLTCELEVLTRLFTADHQRAQPATGERGDRRKIFPFLRSGETPILQATSLKGMIRAVYEAAFPSCLPLAAAAGVSKQRGQDVFYSLTLPAPHRHESCNDPNKLCPACRLFGIAQGDEVHAQGRVIFSDAILAGDGLETGEVKLAELSSPKPHHYPIYSQTGAVGGTIRGRKFYYHHDPDQQPVVAELGPRSNAISELAPRGRRFRFKIRLENLSGDEVKQLISCLILDDEHAHKLGMAKPLGYGSCRIRICEEESFIERGGERYRNWQRDKASFSLSNWEIPTGWLTGSLGELLRRDRPEAGPTGYLPLNSYRNKGIDPHGRYVTRSPMPAAAPSSEPPQTSQKSQAGAFAGILHQAEQPKSQDLAKRKRATLEVIKDEAGQYTLRDPETGQDDIKFRGTGVPWRVGDRVKVRISETTRDGRIKKIQPG